MRVTRRGFVAMLGAVPLLGRLVPAPKTVTYQELSAAAFDLPTYMTWSVPGGSLTIPKNFWTETLVSRALLDKDGAVPLP